MITLNWANLRQIYLYMHKSELFLILYCLKDIKDYTFKNLTLLLMEFTLSFDEGGGVDSIHPLFTCEHNRKSKKKNGKKIYAW